MTWDKWVAIILAYIDNYRGQVKDSDPNLWPIVPEYKYNWMILAKDWRTNTMSFNFQDFNIQQTGI